MSGNRNPRNPFEGFFGDGHDPFDDPFFTQFRQHIDTLFGNFNDFDVNYGEKYSPHQNANHSNSYHHGADLSAINPNTPMIESNTNADNDDNDDKHSGTTVFVFQPHSYGQSPAYDDYTLSDINPNIPTGDGPITHEDYPGFIEKRGNPPGFHNPYFPGYHGVEKPLDFGENPHQIRRSFARSQSVVIQRGADGKTTKTTTIRDGNGQIHTTTEVYDSQNNDGQYIGNEFEFGNEGMFRSLIEAMFGMKSLDMNPNSTPDQELFPIRADDDLPSKEDEKYRMYPLFQQISTDPLLRMRNFWNRWKPKFKNSAEKIGIEDGSHQRKGKNDSWFWGSNNNQGRHNNPEDK